VIAASSAANAREDADAAKAAADEATSQSAYTAAAYAASEAALAARDSSAAATTASADAIAMGTPFLSTDASADLAVLVGQNAKTYAEQQAAIAQIRADEANKAAAQAKYLADHAQADAKVAVEAAAAAATDAAAAATSAKAAQVSAAAAAADAKAAQESEERTAQYDTQAQLDAWAAEGAALSARDEADVADSEANDAERDAAGARAAAAAAESEAATARSVADEADSDATRAENAAANAQQLADEAESAADQAEAEERAEEQARVNALLASGANPGGYGVEGGAGAALSADDEAILLAQCGQSCVDEYRKAMADANLTLLDWLKDNGGQILLDLIGYTDAKTCFTEGDIEGCLWTAVNGVSLVLLIGKIPAVSAAVVRVSSGVTKFFEAAAAGKRSLDRLRQIIERARKLPDPKLPPCPIRKAAIARAAAAELPVPCFGAITKGKNFKPHYLDHRAILAKILNKTYPKWKVDEGAEFLVDLHDMIKDGRLAYVGKGTIPLGSEAAHIYRGQGATAIIKDNGEFWTLLKSGTGMDLYITMAS
jgi:hypothetical protein